MKPRDLLDRRILAFLEDDARVSATELARRLGIARSTVNERIARLEREGVILGYSAIVRSDPSETSTNAILFVKCERRKLAAITSSLRAFPEIKHCASITGEHDLACRAQAPSTEDLDALIDEVASLNGILSLDTTVILATKFAQAAEGLLGNHVHQHETKALLRVVE